MVVPAAPSPPDAENDDPFLVNRVPDEELERSTPFEVERSEWDLDGFPEEPGSYGL